MSEIVSYLWPSMQRGSKAPYDSSPQTPLPCEGQPCMCWLSTVVALPFVTGAGAGAAAVAIGRMVARVNIASHPWQMPVSSVCARTLIRSRANCTKGRQYRKKIQRLWINDLTQRDPMGQQSAYSGGRCSSVVRGAASKDRVLRGNIPLGRYRMLRPDKMAAPKRRVKKAVVNIASITWPKARSYRSFEGRRCSKSQSGGPFIWKHGLVARSSSLQIITISVNQRPRSTKDILCFSPILSSSLPGLLHQM